jgi:hypothetical protein
VDFNSAQFEKASLNMFNAEINTVQFVKNSFFKNTELRFNKCDNLYIINCRNDEELNIDTSNDGFKKLSISRTRNYGTINLDYNLYNVEKLILNQKGYHI